MKLIVNTLDHFQRVDGIVQKYLPYYYNTINFEVDEKVNDGVFMSVSFDDEVSIMGVLKLITISRVAFILIDIATEVNSRISEKNRSLIDDYLKMCNYEKVDIPADNMLCYGMVHRGLIYNG